MFADSGINEPGILSVESLLFADGHVRPVGQRLAEKSQTRFSNA
jgi:hypothetical protein